MGVLQTHDLEYSERLRMACDVMCAVAHMHKLNFVHRDLKSLNFFVNIDGQQQLSVRLGDFGETLTITQAGLEVPQQSGSLKW